MSLIFYSKKAFLTTITVSMSLFLDIHDVLGAHSSYNSQFKSIRLINTGTLTPVRKHIKPTTAMGVPDSSGLKMTTFL